MNKELVGILLLFIALFSGALYYSKTVQEPFISLLHSVKTGYLDSVTYIGDTVEEHFLQQNTILELRHEVQTYKESHLMLHEFAAELSALYRENRSGLKLDPKVELVRTLSYVRFGDINKVWLEVDDYNASRIYGLTRDGMAAGIVIPRNGRPVALLNHDPKSTYAVFVGSDKAPGIVHGRNSNTMVVRFIPNWMRIQVGDEVVTSGLDNLFFEGIKVGKVISFERSQGFQEAVIEPYVLTNDPDYFHMIRSVH